MRGYGYPVQDVLFRPAVTTLDGSDPVGAEPSGVRDVFLLNGAPETGVISLNFSVAPGDTSVFDSTDLPASLDLGDFSISSGSIRAERPSGFANPALFRTDFSIDTITATIVSEPFVLGDVDRNGVVNFLDINAFITVLSSNGFQDEADINRDGAVNFLDIAPFIVILSGQ